MTLIISSQLKEIKGIRILLLEGKRPMNKGWTLNPEYYERQEDGSWKHKETGEVYKVQEQVFYNEPGNFGLDDPQVEKIIESGWNAGFLTGSGGVEVLDIDSKELYDWAIKNLPNTYMVKTGSEEEHYHLYYKRKGTNQKIILDKENKHFGEWMASGQQVVMAGSIHPITKKEYIVINDVPISEISEDDIDLLKENFTEQGKTFVVQSPDWSMYVDLSGIEITPFVNLSSMKKYRDEYFGSHPIHGSKTGMNFFVNLNKNLWHCYRHDSGGDALSLIAMLEGICSCEDFTKNGKKLRGNDFKKTLDVLKDKYHLEIKNKNQKQNEPIHPQFEIKVISAKELMAMDIPVPSWIVKNLIPEEGLVVIAGKTASMKSFLSTTMGLCSIFGLNFLGKFETKKGLWLYIDEENPLRITKDRTEKILYGLGVDAPEDFKYICHSGIKLDVDEHFKVLEEIIQRYKPVVIVLDSLVRFLLNADENSAAEISAVFSKLRRLTFLYKTTFVIIHHLRKGAKDRKDEDQDERVRGSTDIVNAVDCLLIISRKDKNSPYINIKQEKNRFDREIDPFVILVKQDDERKGVSFEVTSSVAQEQSVSSKAANQILEWLSSEKKWEDVNNKIFKTAEVIDRFDCIFNQKPERNRKIILEALMTLIVKERLEKCESKGYYKFIELIEFDVSKEDIEKGDDKDDE